MSIKKLLPLIGIIIFIYILTTLDLQKIFTVFSLLSPGYVLLSFFAMVPVLILVNYEWQLILTSHKIRISSLYSLKNIFIGYFYGFITPGGFGAYTRAIYLRDESGSPLSKCVVNIVLINTVDTIALLILGVIGGLILSSKIPLIFPVFLLLLILIISLMVLLLRKELGKRFFTRLLHVRFLHRFTDKWSPYIDTLYEELPTPRDLLFPLFVSLLGWILWFSELYLVSQLFAIPLSYLSFMIVVAVASVIVMIPISIYGLGTREATLLGLFSLYGVAPERVVSFSLFWFVIAWLVPSIIGAGVTFLESRQGKKVSVQ